VAGHLAGLDEGQVVLVDALAHLDGQRDVAPGRLAGGCLHDGGEQVGLPGQGCSPAAPGDLGDGAAEVQVDVVRAVLLDDQAHRGTHGRRIHAVELHGTDVLVVVMGDDPHGHLVALHQCPGGDHFRHVQPSAVFAA